MGNIIYEDLVAATITYNGVQFGGDDSDYKSTPPVYLFRGGFKYDESDRAIVATRYELTIIAYFYEASESLMATNAAALKQKLSVPGKELKIVGLGTGFGTLVEGEGEQWGPKPLGFEWRSIGGQLGFEVVWTVEFYVKECDSVHTPLAFTAFNFSTTWRNDFEGLCDRTISGYVEIVAKRRAEGPFNQHVVDEVRNRINVLIPWGFRRISNVWQEDYAKARMTFSIVDEALPGNPFPQGCTRASGNLAFGSVGPGFATSELNMNMNLRTSPEHPPSLAGTIFLGAALSKYGQLVRDNPGGSVLVQSISMAHGQFDNSRDSSFSISFSMTKCLSAMMTAANLWKPITEGTYDLWRASVGILWGNRGVNQLQSNPNDSIIIDLCGNKDTVTIGGTPSRNPQLEGVPLFPRFVCPAVPADGGWLRHEMQLKILRKDEMTWHKKAVQYLPTPGAVANAVASAGKMVLGGPSYDQSQDEQKHDVEHHGLPEVYVAVIFKGLRFVRQPDFPQLKSIAGVPAHLYINQADAPRVAFDILSCPVWYVSGVRIYRVNGYVPEVKAIGSEASCVSSFDRSQEY